jgi:hypothetical protein
VNTGPQAQANSRDCLSVQQPIVTSCTIRGTFVNGVAVDELLIGHAVPAVIDFSDEDDLPPTPDNLLRTPDTPSTGSEGKAHAVPLSTWSERHVPIEPGVPVEVPELGMEAKYFSELLGPAHRWAGWPRCAYDRSRSKSRSKRGRPLTSLRE